MQRRGPRNPAFGGGGGGAQENFVVGMENYKPPAKVKEQFKRGDFVVDGNVQKPKA